MDSGFAECGFARAISGHPGRMECSSESLPRGLLENQIPGTGAVCVRHANVQITCKMARDLLEKLPDDASLHDIHYNTCMPAPSKIISTDPVLWRCPPW